MIYLSRALSCVLFLSPFRGVNLIFRRINYSSVRQRRTVSAKIPAAQEEIDGLME